MRRKSEEYRKTEEQRRVEAQERRMKSHREEDEREYLPYSVASWIGTIVFSINIFPSHRRSSEWVMFGFAVLITIIAVVTDFRRQGFTEKSWLSLILDAILMAITLAILID